MKAKITRLDPEVSLPKYQTQESAAFDIAVNESSVISAGESKLLKTGLIIESPEGYFLMLAARSSLLRKKSLKLGNGIGVIDRDYSGPQDEICLLLHNVSDQPVEVLKGERLAQGIFLKVDQVIWEETENIRFQDRGGLGSTGGYEEKK